MKHLDPMLTMLTALSALSTLPWCIITVSALCTLTLNTTTWYVYLLLVVSALFLADFYPRMLQRLLCLLHAKLRTL